MVDFQGGPVAREGYGVHIPPPPQDPYYVSLGVLLFAGKKSERWREGGIIQTEKWLISIIDNKVHAIHHHQDGGEVRPN